MTIDVFSFFTCKITNEWTTQVGFDEFTEGKNTREVVGRGLDMLNIINKELQKENLIAVNFSEFVDSVGGIITIERFNGNTGESDDTTIEIERYKQC